MNQWTHPTCATPVVDLDGHSWGISDESELLVQKRPAGACNTAAVPGLLFRDYVIDVPVVLTRLIEEGFVTLDYLKDAEYTGSNLGGVEIFGPAAVRSEVQAHSLYVVDGQSQDFGSLIAGIKDQLNNVNVDPDFLGKANKLEYREVIPKVENCEGPITEGAGCAPYGATRACGDKILTCGNSFDGIAQQWFNSGVNISCTEDQSPGRPCNLNSQTTCRRGDALFACTTPRYSGALYPNLNGAAPVRPSQGAGDYSKLAPGNYRFTGNGALFKIKSNASRTWCWYNMYRGEDGQSIPIEVSVAPPQDLRDPYDSGRCIWDFKVGDYIIKGVGPGVDGNMFYYDGGSSWCWFTRPRGPLKESSLIPQAVGIVAETGIGTPGGRCSFDPL